MSYPHDEMFRYLGRGARASRSFHMYRDRIGRLRYLEMCLNGVCLLDLSFLERVCLVRFVAYVVDTHFFPL
jgi:hypothetical protein